MWWFNPFNPNLFCYVTTREHSVTNLVLPEGAHTGHNSRMKPDVWGRSTGTIFILVNIWSHIMVPQTSIMYTMAGDEQNCENKVARSDWNFVHAYIVSGNSRANRRSSESLSDKTIIPSGYLIGSVTSLFSGGRRGEALLGTNVLK